MSWGWIVVCAVGLWLQKALGAFVPQRLVTAPRLRATLVLLPIALFAALTVTQTVGGPGGVQLDARVAGVAAAAAALALRAPFLVVIAVAAAVTAGVRALG